MTYAALSCPDLTMVWPTLTAGDVHIPNPFESIPNPFAALGGAASGVGASLWTAGMLAIWNAGLFLFRLILNLMDSWLTPDLTSDGPAGSVYAYCFWLAGVLMVVFLVAQLGLAAFRRDAKLLGRAVVGAGQFVLIWSSWIGYCVALIAACGGLTRALLEALFGGARLSQIKLWEGFSTDSVTSSITATVLGFLGIFLIISSLAHLMVFLVRSASLIVLVATSQISAAGLVSEFGRGWFWKSVRWVHAAALSPVLMILVLGIGLKMTEGVATGLPDTTQQAIGSAVPGVLLVCMSAVCPYALFKLLAFVEPGTATGAAMRHGLAAHGGVQGLLSGQGAGAATGSGAASATDQHGTSSGEDAAESATTGRFGSAMKAALGPVGAGIGAASSLGAKATAIGTDLNNQAGVGDHNQYPDFTGAGQQQKRTNQNTSSTSRPVSAADGETDPGENPGQSPSGDPGGPGDPGGGDPGRTPQGPSQPKGPVSAPGSAPGGGGGPAGGPGGAPGGGAGGASGPGGAGGAGAVGAVPPVAV